MLQYTLNETREVKSACFVNATFIKLGYCVLPLLNLENCFDEQKFII